MLCLASTEMVSAHRKLEYEGEYSYAGVGGVHTRTCVCVERRIQNHIRPRLQSGTASQRISVH